MPLADAPAKTGDASPYRPWQVRILAATWLAYAGYYFCRKPFYVAKAGIADALTLSATDVANLGTAYLVAYMVGQFASAYFGKKLGPKLLLLAGTGISIASTALFGAANSFETVMLWIALNGLAQGTGWPGCIGSLAHWFRRRERGSVLGLWSTCYQAGPIAATLLASYLLGTMGWRWSFFGGAVVLLAIWFLILLLHPNRPEDAGLPAIEDGDEGAAHTGGNGESKGWDRNTITTIALMGLIYFCIKFLRYALWSWLPWFLNKNFFMTQANAGYLSTVFDICGFAGVMASGFISDQVFKGRRSFLSFIMICMMTLSFFMMYYSGSKSLVLFTVSIGFAGFMLFGPDSLLSGAGAIDVGSKKGALAAAGIINGMGSIGPIFQEQLVGWMYQRYDRSLFPVLFMLVCVASVSAVLTLLLWLRSRRGRSDV